MESYSMFQYVTHKIVFCFSPFKDVFWSTSAYLKSFNTSLKEQK